MGADASHSTQDKAYEILGSCPQWLFYYWHLSCLCHVTLSTVETLQRQNEMRPLLFCLQAQLTVFSAEVSSATQALPRSRVSRRGRDTHGGRTYSQELENGLLERRGWTCSWEPFCKPFRGLIIHKGGQYVKEQPLASSMWVFAW